MTVEATPRAGELRVRLLDGFVLTLPDGGVAGPWERPAARRLVQLLLLTPGHAAAREHLAGVLFARLSPDRASNALSKALTMARAALHEGSSGVGRVLDADRSVIRLRPDLRVRSDVDELREQVTVALREPPGPVRTQALAALRRTSFSVLPEEPYADWLAGLRDELDRLRLEVLVAHARNQGDVEAWSEVAAAEPTNEEACAALVTAYLGAGQRDRAVRTFHRCRAALLEELGVEPSAELAALVPDGAGAPARPARPVRPDPVAAPVGRDELLGRLLRTCERPDRPRAVAVAGPAGIGKTTLVRALCERLEARGWTTRHVTAAPDDKLAPYAGLRVLVEELIGSPVDGWQGRYPLLDAVLSGEGRVSTPTLQATRGRLAAELTALLDDAAGPAPLAVVLDDAHWMDEAQRALVARVAAGRPGRWLLVVVARSDEPRAEAPDLPLEVPRLEVPPLVADAMRDLVRTELTSALSSASPEVVEHVVQRSRGNAFFGLELARQWLAGGDGELPGVRVPERIVALLRRRIGVCSAPARRLVPLVALAGREATYELVLQVGAQEALAGSAEHCMRALDELAQAHLVTETASGLRLLHPLLRDAALATVNPIRRGVLHGLLADGLAELGGEPLSVARHRLAAFAAARLGQLAPDAARAGFEAGRLARGVFANDAATELLRGGLDAFSVLPPQTAAELRPQAVRAWITIADIHLDEEDTAAATDAARVAIALAATDDERASAWAKLAGVSYRRGDLAGYCATLEEGLRALGPDVDATPRARLLSDLGWGRHRMGRREQARVLYEQARPVLEAAGDPVPLARCLDRLALSVSWSDPAAALAVADQAVATARRSDDASLEAVVLMHRAEVLGMGGRTDEALAELDAAGLRFTRTGDRYMQSVVLWVRAGILERHGDPAAALAARDAELQLLDDVGNLRHVADAQLHRSSLLLALGRADEARVAAGAALAAARACGDAEVTARVERSVAGTVREG